jgi:tetratricopeptide (TPR) repeat protein
MAPLYPYLVAPVFAVCGQDPFAVRLFQALIGTGSVLALYLAARCFFSRSLALTAAVAMLLYYPFTFFEGKVLIASCAVLFLTVCLWLLAWLLRLPLLRLAGAAGVAAGAAAALRPNLILLIPLLIPWFLLAFKGRRRFLRCLLFLAGASLPILPFTLHNYLVANEAVLLSDNGGINFYLGNNPQARGSFHITDPTWGEIDKQHFMARSIAEEDVGHALSATGVSRYWLKKGWAFIAGDPVRYLGLQLQKLKSFIENFEYAIIYAPASERVLTASLFIAFIPFSAFISLATLGIAMLVAGRGRTRTPEHDGRAVPGRGAYALPLIFLAVNLISVLLFFNYSRFRLTALPALILLAIYGCREWTSSYRQGRRLHACSSAAAAVAVLVLSIVPYGDQWRLQNAHGLSTVGTAYSGEREFEEAEKYYTKALEVRPGLDIILVKRGVARIKLDRFDDAKEDLEEAVRLKPESGPHRAALASFYARVSPYRDLDRAFQLIQEAIQKPMRTPMEKAHVLVIEGSIRMEREEFKQAAEAYEEAFRQVPDPVEALFLSGKAWKKAGEKEKARAAFIRVLHLDPDHAPSRQELDTLDE